MKEKIIAAIKSGKSIIFHTRDEKFVMVSYCCRLTRYHFGLYTNTEYLVNKSIVVNYDFKEINESTTGSKIDNIDLYVKSNIQIVADVIITDKKTSLRSMKSIIKKEKPEWLI